MKPLYGIGLMSGTSLDGLDICYVRFSPQTSWEYKIIATTTLAYPPYWEERLHQAPYLATEDLLALHAEYGLFLGETTQRFIEDHHLNRVDFIASHGHTVFHQPQRKFSLQIGDGRGIKLKTGITTFYDFRSQDILLGGNGAPLVPIGDQILFSKYDACLNIGGFSNISFEKEGRRLAFDICPVNIILNYFSKKLALPYDEGGHIAATHPADSSIITKLNALDFYHQTGPKSLGWEWVAAQYLPLFHKVAPKVAIATATQHAAIQIQAVAKSYNLKKILVTGGGAYNDFLLKSIMQNTSIDLQIPDKELVEYKEALVFALMGALRYLGHNNILASATGAAYNHCSGLMA